MKYARKIVVAVFRGTVGDTLYSVPIAAIVSLVFLFFSNIILGMGLWYTEVLRTTYFVIIGLLYAYRLLGIVLCTAYSIVYATKWKTSFFAVFWALTKHKLLSEKNMNNWTRDEFENWLKAVESIDRIAFILADAVLSSLKHTKS